MPIELKFLGVGQTLAQLREMQDRLANWEPIGNDIHKHLIFRQKQLFKSEGRSEGITWPDYGGEPKYGALKQALVDQGKIQGMDRLRYRGGPRERLYPSLTQQKHPDHVWSIKGTQIRFGTKVPYAFKHDEGAGYNMFGEAIPQRRIAVLSDRNVERLRQLIAVWIVRGKRSR